MGGARHKYRMMRDAADDFVFILLQTCEQGSQSMSGKGRISVAVVHRMREQRPGVEYSGGRHAAGRKSTCPDLERGI
jgi:hypothetical protein